MVTNKYTVDWKLIKKWTGDRRLTVSGKILTAMRLIVGLIGFLSGIFFMAFSFYHGKQAVLTLGAAPYILFIIGAVSLYTELFHDVIIARKNYLSVANTLDEKSWTVRINFNNDSITVTGGIEGITFPYSDIIRIDEYGNMVIIYFGNNQSLHVYKNSFSSGCWIDCKKLIRDNGVRY